MAIGALVPLLALDYLSVRSGFGSKWITVPALLLAPLGFFWANWPLLGPTPKTRQIVSLAVVAVLASAVWLFVIALTVVGNFHLAIGGRL